VISKSRINIRVNMKEQDPHARYTLRRGNLIFKDPRMSPNMAPTRVTRRERRERRVLDLESRTERVRMERGEHRGSS
jgi:hypothetical protein